MKMLPALLALAFHFPSATLAQAPAPAATPAAAPYLSPEVHADRRVTFRVQAPRAAEVTFEGDWLLPGDKPRLAKGDKGLWSVTLGPLPPGVFIYSYRVDGVATPDPLNPDVKLRARSAGSIVRIPGDAPEFWDARDVPRGSVEINWHRSAVLGQMREVFVYTPPGYASGKRKYPILYLMHGRNGTAADWTQAGLINYVMDNLIAEKKAVPMIVVMPWLHALPFDAPLMQNNDTFGEYLVKDVVPMIAAKYRVAGDRANRAVFGLSMGGTAALTVGLGHLDLFSHIASYSTGGADGEIEKRIMPALDHPTATNAKLRLLWIGCGKQDAFFAHNEALAKTIADHGVKVTFHGTDGVHNWTLWRQYLHETAPLLFR
jgi:enterochelin esterase family protein